LTSIAYLAGKPVDDADLLAVLGPGLAPSADAPPIPSRDWNAFGFALGVRLLKAYAQQAIAEEHVIDICKTALATVAGAHDLLTAPDGASTVAIIEATLRPMTMLASSPAADLEWRIFRWGTRRIRRNRRLHDALADLARDAAEAHAELAARAGNDPDAARAEELAAQRADATTVLAGNASALL
jgi:hypothetical protein